MPSATTEAATRKLFSQLKPGDRIELVHEVKVGLKRWPTRTIGTVERTERRRHGLHFRRNGRQGVQRFDRAQERRRFFDHRHD
jgi:hypothetical protein